MTQPAAHHVPTQHPSQGLPEKLKRALSGLPVQLAESTTDVDVTLPPESLLRVVELLKTRKELAFDFLRNVAGLDFQAEGLGLKYHFYSFSHGHALQLTVLTPGGHPHVPSLVAFYPAADWHEREAAEMFGFIFDGHPDLKNLLLEQDLHIHPLLKAHPLQAVEILQGIEDGPPGFKF